MKLDRLKTMLRVPAVVNLVTQARRAYFVKVRRALRSHDDKAGVLAHDYSFSSFLTNRPRSRILNLILPLASIDSLTPDSKVLAIGCRFESDLLYLIGYKFKAKNVRGLDMVSYSPWVDVGNMHAMPYADNSWDAIVCGWTLSYSDQPDVAAREMLRVVRPGGVIAIGVSYYPPDRIQQLVDEGRYNGDPSNRLQRVDDILALFKGHVQHVFFHHDSPSPDQRAACVVLFSVRKDVHTTSA